MSGPVPARTAAGMSGAGVSPRWLRTDSLEPGTATAERGCLYMNAHCLGLLMYRELFGLRLQFFRNHVNVR